VLHEPIAIRVAWENRMYSGLMTNRPQGRAPTAAAGHDPLTRVEPPRSANSPPAIGTTRRGRPVAEDDACYAGWRPRMAQSDPKPKSRAGRITERDCGSYPSRKPDYSPLLFRPP